MNEERGWIVITTYGTYLC